MTQQLINLGQADKGNGDPLRVAFDKVNDNFTELYSSVIASGVVSTSASTPVAPSEGDLWWNTNDGNLYVYYSGVWTSANTGVQGPQGAQGEQGAAGPAGIRGLKGNIGDIGPRGYTGETGAQGEVGPRGVKGDKGDTGETGPAGLIGADGTQGPQGIRGVKGDTGIQGPKGDTGVQGPQGPQGGTGGGLAIGDFGRGFTNTLDSGKITTSKLYNRPANLALNNHFVLEVTNGGVVVLPDQSVINGATLKTVPGNYAGITAGPVGKDEDSWVWVDPNGAWISTKESTTAYTWKFDNNGNLTLPAGGDIVDSTGTTVLGGTGGDRLINGASSFSMSSDGTLTLTHPAEPALHPLATTLTIQKASGNYHTISGAYGLSLQATPVPSGYGLNTNTNFVDIFHDGISVNVNNNTWGFGTDGATTFPTLTVPISDNTTPNGTGQTIKFSDSSQQAIIFGPVSTGSSPSAERIIIQGAPGYTGTTGEGGDIYLWAGPGGSTNGDGGDIKVRAGYGPGTGQGGYLNFQAGDSATGAGGPINIESGESGTYGSGGDITVQARSGGEITLRTRTSNGTNNDWLFAADGGLTLPTGGKLGDPYGDGAVNLSGNQNLYAGLASYDTKSWAGVVDATYGPGSGIPAGGGFFIQTNVNVDTKTWAFKTDGGLVFPDATTQTTAYTGGGSTSYTPDDTNNWNEPAINTISAALDELAARVTAFENFEIDGGNAYTPALGELLIDGNGA